MFWTTSKSPSWVAISPYNAPRCQCQATYDYKPNIRLDETTEKLIEQGCAQRARSAASSLERRAANMHADRHAASCAVSERRNAPYLKTCEEEEAVDHDGLGYSGRQRCAELRGVLGTRDVLAIRGTNCRAGGRCARPSRSRRCMRNRRGVACRRPTRWPRGVGDRRGPRRANARGCEVSSHPRGGGAD